MTVRAHAPGNRRSSRAGRGCGPCHGVTFARNKLHCRRRPARPRPGTHVTSRHCRGKARKSPEKNRQPAENYGKLRKNSDRFGKYRKETERNGTDRLQATGPEGTPKAPQATGYWPWGLAPEAWSLRSEVCCLLPVPAARFPVPGSRFPLPASRFPPVNLSIAWCHGGRCVPPCGCPDRVGAAWRETAPAMPPAFLIEGC